MDEDVARIEGKFGVAARAMVHRAAELQGCSVAEFIAQAALEAAEGAIEAAHIIRLSFDDQDRLAELLIAPPGLSPAMARARLSHTRLIAGQ